MDRAGRLVVPKALRERLGLPSGGAVELVERDGVVELTPAPVLAAPWTTPSSD